MATIPPYLERLILQGLAECDTWAFGTSGAGTLRLSKDSFIILTDFCYFHFVDEPMPVVETTPAVADSFVEPTEPLSPITVNYNVASAGIFITGVVFDPSDPAQAQIDFQQALDDFVSGWTAVVTWNGTDRWFITVTTTSPGTAFNGEIPDFTIDESFDTLSPGVFAGGGSVTIPITDQDLIDRAIHQLEFRQKGKRYAWIIASDLELYYPGGAPFYANVTGCYQKQGLYIPFYENVQIGIIQVPNPNTWNVDFSPLSTKSNEPASPGGYGQAGAGFPVALTIEFSAGETYLPVTNERGAQTTGYREQLKFDYLADRALNNPEPVVPFQVKGSARRYPILNIGYVRVNMNWDTFQKEVQKWIAK